MKVNVSDSEMVIMRAVWTLQQATVDQIACQIADSHDWSVATIKTMLGRLVKKGMLTTTKAGRKFIYSATMSECQAVGLMAKALLDKVCAKKHPDVIVGMIGDAQLTAEDLQTIRAALDNKTPACHVHCDCLEKSSECACDHEQLIDEKKVMERIS
jgi:CopY/TcrY family copper transport repressor